MRHIVLLGLTLLAFPSALKSVRLESTRLAPEASVWFEPNHGQVGGRTEWTARAAGAWLFFTSNEVVWRAGERESAHGTSITLKKGFFVAS